MKRIIMLLVLLGFFVVHAFGQEEKVVVTLWDSLVGI